MDITSSLDITNTRMAPSWGSGLSAEDFDKDGDIDLVVCSNASDPVRILENLDDGSFDERFIQLNYNSRAALWIDYNGDHLLDLLIMGDCLNLEGRCPQIVSLFEQQEDGSFVNSTVQSGLEVGGFDLDAIFGGASAGDVNEDGILDVLIVYLNTKSRLLQGTEDGSFIVLEDYFNQGTSNLNWTPILFDITGDGWLDYLQARDISKPNQFYSHKGDLEYSNVAEQYGLSYAAENMGISIGDYDNDNDLDVYIANIEYEAFDRGNVLFRNDGDVFLNQSKVSDVYKGGWSWGVSFMDGNNDGLLDIAATNGWDTYGHDSSRFWLNLGEEKFEDFSSQVGFNDVYFATALIAFDLDRDGDLDLGQTVHPENHDFGVRIYENVIDSENTKNYLVVQPRMRGRNHWAIGSQVKIRSSSGTQMRPITAGTSFFAQEPAEAFFGLGEDEYVEEIEIIWPGGGSTVVTDLSVNSVLEIYDDGVVHPPSNLVAGINNNVLELEWKSNSTIETKFRIEKSSSSSFDSYEIFDINEGVLEYTEVVTDVGEIFFYRVKAVHQEIASRPSVSVEVQMQVEIDSPTDFYGLIVSPVSVELFWTDVSDDELGFIIERSTDEGFSRFIEITVGDNVESYLDENLEPETIYYYRIRAYKEFGESRFSKTLAINLADIILSLEKEFDDVFLIYPNPTNDLLNIEVNTEKVTLDRIKLMDINGAMHKEWTYIKPRNGRVQLNVEVVEAGNYIIVIELRNQILVKQLIIL